jgi:hypothetical protein
MARNTENNGILTEMGFVYTPHTPLVPGSSPGGPIFFLFLLQLPFLHLFSSNPHNNGAYTLSVIFYRVKETSGISFNEQPDQNPVGHESDKELTHPKNKEEHYGLFV